MKFSTTLIVVLSAAMATLQGAAAAPVDEADPGYHLGYCTIHHGHSICHFNSNDWSDYDDDDNVHRHCDPAAQASFFAASALRISNDSGYSVLRKAEIAPGEKEIISQTALERLFSDHNGLHDLTSATT